MREPARRVLAVVAAVAVVTTLVPMPTAAATGSTTTATDDDCQMSTLGLLTGTVNPLDPDNDSDGIALDLYEAAVNPCYSQNNNVTDVDTEEEAKRRVSQLALEDRRFWKRFQREWDTNTGRLENPAYLDGKVAFIAAKQNGSSDSAAITDARQAVHTRFAAQQRSLWRQYASMLRTVATLEAQAEDEQVGSVLLIGRPTSSGFESYRLTGYRDYSSFVNISLADGSQVQVPAPFRLDNGTVVDKLHPLQDDVFVGVRSPETNQIEPIVNKAKRGETVRRSVTKSSGTVSFNSGWSKAEITVNTGADIKAGFKIGDLDFRYGDRDTGMYNYRYDLYEDGSHITWYNPGDGATYVLSPKDGRTSVDAPGRDPFYTDNPTSTVSLDSATSTNYVITIYDKSAIVGVSDYEFRSRHQTLAQKDDSVIDALGNSTSGYLSDVSKNVDLGNINYSDAYTPLEKYRLTSEPSDVGEQSWQNAQYQQLGYGGAGLEQTVKVKILAGSVVNGATLSSNQTYNATLFATASPPNGTWLSGETYTVGSSADMPSGSVYLSVTTTTQTMDNGTIYYETTGETYSVGSGSIKIIEITNSSGGTVSTVDYNSRDPDSVNTSNLTDQINSLQDELTRLRDQIDEDNDGNDPDGGGAGNIDLGKWIPDGGVWSWFPSVQIPVAEASINVVALAGIIIVGGGATILTLYGLTQFFAFWLTVKRLFGFA